MSASAPRYIPDARVGTLYNTSGTNITPASGTYTPTINNLTNLSSVTGATGHYVRVGNVVWVQVHFSVTVTAATTTTNFNVSLPFSTTLSTVTGLNGDGVLYRASGSPMDAVFVNGDTSNHNALARMYPTSNGASIVKCSFIYAVA